MATSAPPEEQVGCCVSRMAAVQSPAPQRLTDNNVLFIGDSLTNPVELTECRINGDMLHLEGMLGQRGLTEAKIWLQQTAPLPKSAAIGDWGFFPKAQDPTAAAYAPKATAAAAASTC